ncbi:uncharacterized protein LOC128329734 [Hemicordylus capensis]|uniref:uncharacterized protein LOC128329734 n=1 Tax=Hemicordylus capensis TaxID=884348 RepID=UPI0023041A7C|nr:uncharacterized protein LOC128329734 [Hemicordylus capensis]
MGKNCCKTPFSFPDDGDNWLPSVGITIFVLVGVGFLAGICSFCYRCCKDAGESLPEEPRRDLPIPPPAFVPPAPSAPSPEPFTDPPPYSEVAWKPYPAPVGQPPAYDNIAMDGISSLDFFRPPALVPKPNV